MSTVLAIAGRELRSAFTGAVGWLVLVGFSLLSGFFFQWVFTAYVSASTELVFDPYAAGQLHLGEHLLAPYFGDLSIVLVLVAPALSMRSFAEELRSRSMELLLTSPVTTAQIVFGKFLGLVAFAGVLLAVSAPGPLSLFWFGSPDVGVIASGYLGLWLLCAASLSMGLAASSFTENQVVALVISFALGLMLYVLGMFGLEDPDGALSQLALTGHLDDLFVGRLKLSDLAYFVAFVATWLFATHQRVESYRWR